MVKYCWMHVGEAEAQWTFGASAPGFSQSGLELFRRRGVSPNLGFQRYSSAGLFYGCGKEPNYSSVGVGSDNLRCDLPNPPLRFQDSFTSLASHLFKAPKGILSEICLKFLLGVLQ